jgi:hypothetical protein
MRNRHRGFRRERAPLLMEAFNCCLFSYFLPFGEIIYVKVPPGKGCGFVQYLHRQSAEQAIAQMNGYTINGSRVRLSWGRNGSASGPGNFGAGASGPGGMVAAVTASSEWRPSGYHGYAGHSGGDPVNMGQFHGFPFTPLGQAPQGGQPKDPRDPTQVDKDNEVYMWKREQMWYGVDKELSNGSPSGGGPTMTPGPASGTATDQ